MPRRKNSTTARPSKSRRKKSSPVVEQNRRINQREKELRAKQKLQRQQLAKKQAEELKEFRRKAAILKRQNIAFINQNVRSLEKSDYRTRLINHIQKTGLFEGRAHVQKLDKDEARILRERGYTVKNRRIVLPASSEKGERLVRKRGQKTRVIEGYDEELGGGYELDIIGYENWDEYLQYLESKWGYFQGNGHQLAFRLYGNLSRETYDDIYSLINKLNEYGQRSPSFAKAMAEDWRETIKHIEVYTTTIPQWARQNDARIKRQQNKRKKARPYKARMQKIFETEGRVGYQLRLSAESAKRKARRQRAKTKK